ncbi:NAD(P)-binding protein [Schizophyllum amplum]|uniref:D-xylose 1-dehydrogenase (NADP(+), D-xylono-1,5-lactone-forming) n=1 Tax=Schizophyllum amplum TaxID=97359 RepID=A0A550CKG1_9AGAR|nr:NAD(P)-binding protein [Auriculariopsis ampla]
MSSPTPFVFKWGIVSTGGIATKYVSDLLVDPKTRDVHDVAHKIVAVGSRSVAKAQDFIDAKINGDKNIKAYGSYDDLYADPNVDGVYIGTPHTFHYANAIDALKAKKHVLCEKPVTSNAAELRALIAAAKENGVFFMEALWTRFQPLSLEIKQVAYSGELGLPIALHADLSEDFDIENIPTTHRMLDPMLGGGALLDLGPYPLIWATMLLFEHPANEGKQPSNITGSLLKTPRTGVDSSAAFTLTFDAAKLRAQAHLTCSMNVRPADGVIVRFERGTIRIPQPIWRPKSFTVEYTDAKGEVVKQEERKKEYVGVGWHFQADEVARCVRDGKTESEQWGHEKSILEMTIFDEVRKQGGYVFPPGVEKVTQ